MSSKELQSHILISPSLPPSKPWQLWWLRPQFSLGSVPEGTFWHHWIWEMKTGPKGLEDVGSNFGSSFLLGRAWTAPKASPSSMNLGTAQVR